MQWLNVMRRGRRLTVALLIRAQVALRAQGLKAKGAPESIISPATAPLTGSAPAAAATREPVSVSHHSPISGSEPAHKG